MNNRVAVWLQEHFAFFKSEPLFKDIMRFLEGNIRETILSALSNDGSFSIVVESNFGGVSYDKTRGKVGKSVIEQVKFMPRNGSGFAFTVVDNELSILRYNGSDPQYSPKVTTKEQQELSEFMTELRKKTERFFIACSPTA